MSNKKTKYKSYLQEAWLSESEYGKWFKKDKNDITLAFCTVCLKSFSVAAHGNKPLVLHASREFHKSRLSTSTQTTVKFAKDKPEEKENIRENKNTLVPQVLVPVPASLGVSYGQRCRRCRYSLSP